MKSLLWPVVLVVLVVAAAVAGWSQPHSGDPGVIKIVSSLPRTGSAKAQTDTIVNGIKIALDEAGWRAGGFNTEYSDLDDPTAGAGQWKADARTAKAGPIVPDPQASVICRQLNFALV